MEHGGGLGLVGKNVRAVVVVWSASGSFDSGVHGVNAFAQDDGRFG